MWTGERARRALAGGLGLVVSLLLGLEARAENRSVGVPTANFRAGPCTSRAVLFTADQYYPVQVLRCEGGWCETRDFEGDVAWVAERLLSKQSTVVVNVNQANVRAEASIESSVLFRVDWGEALKVNERKDDWVSIEDIAGERGWVHSKLTWGLPQESEEGGEGEKEGR